MCWGWVLTAADDHDTATGTGGGSETQELSGLADAVGENGWEAVWAGGTGGLSGKGKDVQGIMGHGGPPEWKIVVEIKSGVW